MSHAVPHSLSSFHALLALVRRAAIGVANWEREDRLAHHLLFIVISWP